MHLGIAVVALPCPGEKSLSRTSCAETRHEHSYNDLFGRNSLRVFQPGVRE
jgi:hypothetical protein